MTVSETVACTFPVSSAVQSGVLWCRDVLKDMKIVPPRTTQEHYLGFPKSRYSTVMQIHKLHPIPFVSCMVISRTKDKYKVHVMIERQAQHMRSCATSVENFLLYSSASVLDRCLLVCS